MKNLKRAILALALGCAAPLALAQTTTYGSGDSKMDNSSTAAARDKCTGMTGSAWDRCMAKNDKANNSATGAGSPKASGRTGTGPSQEPSGGADSGK